MPQLLHWKLHKYQRYEILRAAVSPTEYVPPDVSSPYRTIVLAAATDGWYQASDEEREQRILPRLAAVFDEWRTLGAEFIASVDDDLGTVGQPNALGFSIFVVMDTPSVEALAQMMQRLRVTVDGVRLDRCFRVDARLGRPLFLLDN
jgi:hypothetical protein